MDLLAVGVIDQAFYGPAWQGPTLMGLLKSVKAADAIKAPASGRKSIWQHLLHAAHWKAQALAAFDPAHPALAAFKAHVAGRGSNWIATPKVPDQRAWQADRAAVEALHMALVATVQGFGQTNLLKQAQGTKWSYGEIIAGVACHDMYHAGQIALIKRLLAAKPRASTPATPKPKAKAKRTTARV
jgi:uncharacterized damage-inducible protein DinB